MTVCGHTWGLEGADKMNFLLIFSEKKYNAKEVEINGKT